MTDTRFIFENKGWIAGSGGTLLATTDGGKNWEKNIDFTQDTMKQVFFTGKNGWIVGFGGTILKKAEMD